MRTKFFCPRWGSENLLWVVFMQRVEVNGFDGIEYAIPANTRDKELDEVWNLLAKYNLQIIPQHYDTHTADFNQHFDEYSAWLERIKKYPSLKINSQTGKDFFSFEQNAKLIRLGTSKGVIHETHRGKFSFAAHITKSYLEKIPDLRLALDASHWVNVAESFLDDQVEAMDMAVKRTDHIHARVGYPEGPQVPDPRSYHWEHALTKHLRWWDQVHNLKTAAGETLTITPEFGPFPYMVHLPINDEPIASQWDINLFMMKLLRKKYQ